MSDGAVPYRLQRVEVRTIAGQDVDKRETEGEAAVFEVTGPEGLRVLVRDVRWHTGLRDVALLDRLDAPMRFDRLASGLRLAVNHLPQQLWFDLRQARTKPTGRSNLFDATEPELDDGAGCSVRAALLAAGATRVGTREAALGDAGPRRSKLCVTAPESAEAVPVMGYALTRLAPILREVPA